MRNVTHYVGYFCIEESAAYNPSGKPSRNLRAVCGVPTDYPRWHSNEPTCPACKAWLEQDAKEAAEIEVGLGR